MAQSQILREAMRLKWTKPPHTSLLLGTVMDLARGKSELVVEHALLRQQLIILRRQVNDQHTQKRIDSGWYCW